MNSDPPQKAATHSSWEFNMARHRPDKVPPAAGHTHIDTLITPRGEPIKMRPESTPTDAPTTSTILTFLTINAQKAGTNSPSLSDIVTILDDHSPGILFITETPLHIRNGALLHVLRNRGFHIRYHPANAPSPPDALLKARIPTHLTHTGGGTWLPYRKHAPWSFMVRPLTIPEECPSTTTCAVEITLLTCAKAVLISCYLPQAPAEHAQVCKALTNLTQTLPHHVFSMGGGAYKTIGTAPPQKAPTSHLSRL